MMKLSLIFLLISIINTSASTSPDYVLPEYMRGMQWHKVQEYLKTDLSLPGAVIPISYAIELTVNVRGHAGAAKSDFNGTVIIELDLNRAVDSIELHSMGLMIEKAELIDNVIMNEPVEVSNISANTERESITIHANRTIQLHEKFMLKISYRGLAIMDEYGLYENWDPKHNISADSNGHYILASNNFPTGARYWFPCFDEPDKKATFELRVNHPAGLNVYSNTEVKRTESVNDGRRLTIFGKTRPLSTYHVALSVNHFVSENLEIKGFGKVRLIISNNSWPYATTRDPASISEEYYAFDVQGFIKRNLKSLVEKTSFEIPQEKLDIIILDGSNLLTVQPGLITVGRHNLISDYKGNTMIARDCRNMTQLLIGNRITVRESKQIWMNEMFSYFLTNATDPEDPLNFAPDLILHASLHEKPLRHQTSLSTSTSQYLASRNPIPPLKASQILKLLDRYCPSSKKAVKNYINTHLGGFANIDDFIHSMSNACENPATAKEFLEDFIDQPGKALLIVKRTNNTVTITQTRYHSTYFNSQLRDNKTRYTIPILYTVDGFPRVKIFNKKESSITIEVPQNAVFLIEHEFDHLYFAYYQDIIIPQRSISEGERDLIFNSVRKSMLAALSIGFVNYTEFQEQWKSYAEIEIATNHALIFRKLMPLLLVSEDNSDRDESKSSRCERATLPTWNGLANSDEWYWQFNGDMLFLEELECVVEWYNASTYKSFLDTNFLESTTAIRPSQMPFLPARNLYYSHWQELHRLFFRNAHRLSNHRFTLLAQTVLNQADAGAKEKYPAVSIHADYVNELRNFVIRAPHRAASMATEIEMRLEREFIRRELPRFHNVTTERQLWVDYDTLKKEKKGFK